MWRLVAFLPVALCAALGGCADFAAIGAARDVRVGRGPPDEKRFAELARSVAQVVKLSGNLEVSALHETHPPQGGDWMFCVRGIGATGSAEYAAFLRDNAVLDYRSGVALDGCSHDTYRPLAPP